jgi:hypothetical protein
MSFLKWQLDLLEYFEKKSRHRDYWSGNGRTIRRYQYHSISLRDYQYRIRSQFLGNTLDAIAFEKSRNHSQPNVPVIYTKNNHFLHKKNVMRRSILLWFNIRKLSLRLYRSLPFHHKKTVLQTICVLNNQMNL